MNPTEVLKSFPEEHAYEDWMGGNLNDALLFRGVIFLFDGCDASGPVAESRMYQYTVRRREDVFLWGRSLTSWTRETVEAHLNANDLQFFTTTFTPETRAKYDIRDASRIEVDYLDLSLDFSNEGLLEDVTAQ